MAERIEIPLAECCPDRFFGFSPGRGTIMLHGFPIGNFWVPDFWLRLAGS
jgi:hypothetical protein